MLGALADVGCQGYSLRLHWEDPLKAWGEVLLKQGKTKEALAKYDEALKYAPNWKQLKQARQWSNKSTFCVQLPQSVELGRKR